MNACVHDCNVCACLCACVVMLGEGERETDKHNSRFVIKHDGYSFSAHSAPSHLLSLCICLIMDEWFPLYNVLHKDAAVPKITCFEHINLSLLPTSTDVYI